MTKDPFLGIKFPDGKYKKYKKQTGTIEKAVDKYAAGLREDYKGPKLIAGGRKVADRFSEGRARREAKIDKIKKNVPKAPEFKDFKKSIKKIRQDKSSVYGGKFAKIGKSLNIKYDPKSRKSRSSKRLKSIKVGLKSSYTGPDTSSKKRQKTGSNIIKSMRLR
jgi:hypothetical protein